MNQGSDAMATIDLPEPDIDMAALAACAKPDDDTPVVVTSRFLKRVEIELRAAARMRNELAMAVGLAAVINAITSGARGETVQ